MNGWKRHLRHRLIVNLKTGKTIAGVLWTADRNLLVLKAAELVDDTGRAVTLDGDIVVERANVDFVQSIAPVTGPGHAGG